MSLWKNRPLFSVCCIWIFSALFGFFLVPSAKICIALALLGAALSLAVLCAVRRYQHRRPCFSGGIFLLCLLLSASAALAQSYLAIDRKEAVSDRYAGTECEVVGTVTECRGRGGQMSTFVLELSEINGEPVRQNVLLTCYYVADLKPGHTLRMTAEISSLADAAGNIYEEYALLGDGIFGGALSKTADDYTLITEAPSTPQMSILRHRALLSEHTELLFGEECEGLPSALLLGDRTHLSDTLKKDFERIGTSHMLAISGLHITLLFGFLAALLKLFRLPPRLRAVILTLTATAYLTYLGFPPSATRAVVMLGMTYLASLCYAGADPLTSLGLAGALILLFSPTTVSDVGFWMSFSATFGILTVMPLFKKNDSVSSKPSTARSFLRSQGMRLLGAVCAGVAAVAASLWITAPVMGKISLLSLPMTLVLTPFIGLLLILTPLALLTEAFFFGPVVISAVKITVSIITSLSRWGDAPWAMLSLRHTAVGVIVFIVMLSTLYLLGRSLRKKAILLLPMAVGVLLISAIIAVSTSADEKDIQISYIIPSSEAEMLVMTSGSDTVICEISNGSHSAFMSATREAARQGATEISVFMLTDYHSRTSGSLQHILNRETVRELWMPKPTSEADYYLMLSCLEVAERASIPTVIYDHGQALTVFESSTLCLQREMIPRSQKPVLLLTLDTPSERLSFCGSSISESLLSPQANEAIRKSETVILSSQGPNLKQAIRLPLSEQVSRLCIADKTVAAYISPDTYPTEGISMTVGQAEFRLRRESKS
ncbi:MAG: ComEC/Rec2 family competence protein [Clostridia bacterium]|nr:ComEC/Rec2 family competence protein [Clostridia bacterium]